MLHVKLVAVGRIKEPYLRAAVNEYLQRLSAYAKVEVVEVKEEGRGTPVERIEAEGQRIRAALPERCHLVVLDERGQQFSSVELAAHIDRVAGQGCNRLCFVIGGAEGLSPDLRRQADLVWSFSRLTFPHQLFRVMLLEQIYRAFTIQKGEPYHRAGMPGFDDPCCY